jgi:CheY-like chemotaxis protein
MFAFARDGVDSLGDRGRSDVRESVAAVDGVLERAELSLARWSPSCCRSGQRSGDPHSAAETTRAKGPRMSRQRESKLRRRVIRPRLASLQVACWRSVFALSAESLGTLNGNVMRRILIVEDEPEALELLVSWIQHQRGWEIRSAQSGKSAIELSKTFKPDVVVSDYLLQDDVTGVDVIAEVQAHDAPVRCVLVTGVLRKALLDVQRISGVPILTKPLDFRRLRRIISEVAS